MTLVVCSAHGKESCLVLHCKHTVTKYTKKPLPHTHPPDKGPQGAGRWGLERQYHTKENFIFCVKKKKFPWILQFRKYHDLTGPRAAKDCQPRAGQFAALNSSCLTQQLVHINSRAITLSVSQCRFRDHDYPLQPNMICGNENDMTLACKSGS